MATEDLRDNLAITLHNCRLTAEGPILCNGIRRNRGPTSLEQCHFNARPLAEALRGNTRIKHLVSRLGVISAKELRFLLQALAENLCIEELNLEATGITDEGWTIMCQSLANHPALDCLHLMCTATFGIDSSWRLLLLSEARKSHRTQCLVEMLKVNTIVKHIHMIDAEYDETIWRDEIIPRLEMNRLRPRIVAVKKTQGTLRAPLFGRALHTIRDNNTFLFMMAKGNVDSFAGLARVRTRKCRKRTQYSRE